jgi:hypothetical protein
MEGCINIGSKMLYIKQSLACFYSHISTNPSKGTQIDLYFFTFSLVIITFSKKEERIKTQYGTALTPKILSDQIWISSYFG